MTRWLLHQKTGPTVVTSRSGCYSSTPSFIQENHLRIVEIVKCDNSFMEDSILSRPDESRQMTALFHAGGILADATLMNQSFKGIFSVFAPKVSGMQNLRHSLSFDSLFLRFLFSSMASLLGSIGQMNYSVANAWLDVYAEQDQMMGSLTMSVQFGAWKGAGMAVESASKMEALGLGSLSAESGLHGISGFLKHTTWSPINWIHSQIAISPIEWVKFLENSAEPVPFFLSMFSHLKKSRSQKAGTISGSQKALILDESMIHSQVEAVAVSIIGSDVGHEEPLMAAGLDSLGAVELRNGLESQLGLELPSTLVFDYPTINSITDYIRDNLISEDTDVVQVTDVVADVANIDSSDELIRVSCLSQRLPMSYQEQNYAVDCISMIPTSRWDSEISLTEDMSVRFGAFVESVYEFDAAIFSLSQAEAALVDPQQRMILEMAEEIVVQSRSISFKGKGSLGIHESSSHFLTLSLCHADNAVGVFVGISTPDFADIAKKYSSISTYSATGSALSVAAGRVSYLYGFNGTAVSVDTACSSSLVGLHMAKMSMSNQSCSASLVAGIKLILTPETSAMFNRAGMLASDGRCKTLDSSANGYVRGEAGVAMLIDMAPLDANAPVILKGTAVNQDGRSSALTAPNGPAQQIVMRQAMSSASMSSDLLSLIQMHGTGTPLGDPIEVGAIAAVHKKGGKISLMAGKTSYGHTEPSAGLLGVLHAYKAALSRQQQPIMHLTEVNPYAQASLKQSRDLKFNLSRELGVNHGGRSSSIVAGISSFAFQGTNAHTIIAAGHGNDSSSKQFGCRWHKRFINVLPVASPLITSIPKVSWEDLAFEVALNHPLSSFLHSHRVSGRAIFPGAGYMEVMSEVASLLDIESVFTQITFAAPLPMDVGKDSVLLFNLKLSTGEVNLATKSLHVKGHVSNMNGPLTQMQSAIETISASISEPIATSYIYDKFREAGLEYGPEFRILRSVKAGSTSATGILQQERKHARAEFILNPSLLDCTLQLGGIIKGSKNDQTMIPATLSALLVRGRVGQECIRGIAERSPGVMDSTTSIVRDLTMTHENGKVICTVYHLESRSIGAAPPQERLAIPEDFTYTIQWTADCQIADPVQPSESHFKIVHCKDDAASASSIISILQQMALLDGSLVNAYGYGREILQGIAPGVRGSTGGQLWGMLRTFGQECPNISVKALQRDGIDVDSDGLNCLSFDGKHNENSFDGYGIAVGSKVEYKPKMMHAQMSNTAPSPYQLLPDPRGSLNNLAAFNVPKGDLKQQEALVMVKAIGINFRDVLNVLGMYPGDPGPPGGDCAGIVIATGHDSSLTKGQAVFGLAAGSLGSHVIASTKTMVPMPTNVSFTEAATMPTVFVTVDSALQRAASLSSGDRVLVHAAAGGVGLAAVQLINASGATFIATAGSSSKRTLLRSLGVKHLASSRDLEFCEAAMSVTGSLDVILNTLTSTGFVACSLAAMSAGGRIIEISKRDIWSPVRILQERPDMSYTLVAVDFMSEDALNKALIRVANGVAMNQLKPLPFVSHSLSQVGSALRQMSQARHIGKIVVNNERGEQPRKIGSTLITGGLGTLGQIVARWLIQEGSADMKLVGRSGLFASCDASLIGQQTCSFITAVKGDLSSHEDLEYLCSTSENKGPVKLVMHAAGTLADATITKQTAKGAKKVYSAKVNSAIGLLESLYNYPTFKQVQFSSVASLLGAPGQLNYSGANAALDHLSSLTQQYGLPAASVQWGPWSGGGMASKETEARAQRMGMGMIVPERGINALESVLSSTIPIIGANPFNWTVFGQRLKSKSLLFEEFVTDQQMIEGGKLPNSTVSANKGGMDKEAIEAKVAEVTASVMGTTVSTTASLMEAGLDSLGAVELRNSLSKSFGIDLPATLTFDFPTQEAIAGFLCDTIGVDEQEISGPLEVNMDVVRKESSENLIISGISMRYVLISSALPPKN